RRLRGGVQRVAESGDQAVDLGLLDNERRRELDRIAAVADVRALREALHRDLERALRRLAGRRVERDARREADVADVGDGLGAPGLGHRVFPGRGEPAPARDRVVFDQYVERGHAGRARDRVRRVGVAVRELEHVLGAARGHERVVDRLRRDDAAERLYAVRDLLGEVEKVGRDAERLGAGVRADAAEPGDDLVEDQKDVVLGADLAQALEVALRRRDDAPGAGHRL